MQPELQQGGQRANVIFHLLWLLSFHSPSSDTNSGGKRYEIGLYIIII